GPAARPRPLQEYAHVPQRHLLGGVGAVEVGELAAGAPVAMAGEVTEQRRRLVDGQVPRTLRQVGGWRREEPQAGLDARMIDPAAGDARVAGPRWGRRRR